MCFTPTHPSLFWKMQDTFFHFRRIQFFVRRSWWSVLAQEPIICPRLTILTFVRGSGWVNRVTVRRTVYQISDGTSKRGWSVVMSAVRLEFELSLLVMAQPIRALYFNPHTFWFLPLISTTLSLSTLPAERICNQGQSLKNPYFTFLRTFFEEIYNCPHFFIWVHGKTL